MKRFAGANEHPTAEAIPEVARAAIVAAEPPTIVIVLHVEHLEVPVRVGFI